MSVSGVLRSKTLMSKPSSFRARMASRPSFSRGPPRRTHIRTFLSLPSAFALRKPLMIPPNVFFTSVKFAIAPADDDVPDSWQGADFLGQHFDRPIGGVAGVFSIVGQF